VTGLIGYLRPMRHVGIIIGLAAVVASSSALAAEPVPLQNEYRLSAEQIEQVLRDAEAKPQLPADNSATRSLPIRGQVGVGIGTDGYRSMFGAFELGDPNTQGRAWFDMDWRQLNTRTRRNPAQ
jgi:hypothetical protein